MNPENDTEDYIIVADDDESVRNIACEMLEIAGYQVLPASNGTEVIRQYSKYRQHVKVVLLDLFMPQLSGYQTFLQLTELDPNVKAIMVSGNIHLDEQNPVLKDRIAGFVQKPFEMKHLISTVNNIINNQN